MIELYHNDFSTCAQKVRIVLAEKGLDWKDHHLDLASGDHRQPDYVKLNPNKVVPTLVHEGRVYIESSQIIQYLDDAFDAASLSPDDAHERYLMNVWSRLTDDKIHMVTGLMTITLGTRSLLTQKSPEEREAIYAGYKNPAVRERRRSVIEEGTESPFFREALVELVRTLDDMEQSLMGSSWLTGETFSLADINLAVNVERFEALALSPLLSAQSRPALNDWLQRLKARASWETGVIEWTPAPKAKFYRANGETEWPVVEKALAEIQA